jgi:hypothetical protein
MLIALMATLTRDFLLPNMQQVRACLRRIKVTFSAVFSPCARFMAGQAAARFATGVELSTVNDAYLDFGKVCGFQRCFVGMLMPLMTFSTITVMSKMVSAIWWEIMTICAIPFPLLMACRSTIPCDRIVYDLAQFDGTRLVV